MNRSDLLTAFSMAPHTWTQGQPAGTRRWYRCQDKTQSLGRAGPRLGVFCFLTTSNAQEGPQSDVHTPGWLGVTLPAQGAGNLPTLDRPPGSRGWAEILRGHRPGGQSSGPELESLPRPTHCASMSASSARAPARPGVRASWFM